MFENKLNYQNKINEFFCICFQIKHKKLKIQTNNIAFILDCMIYYYRNY